MNILNLINNGSNKLKLKKIVSAKLDSEILLSKILNKRREEILINLNETVDLKIISKFSELIKRRSLNEPIAYITNEKEFWSKNFYVNQDTLIPRPETELMVERLLGIFKNKSIFILDIGTGSGCILISLLSELKHSKGLGIDISKKALQVAKKNAYNHKITSNINFLKRSFEDIYDKKFDLIVSNPPYIMRKDIKNLDIDIKRYEPLLALNGGNDGLDVIKKVIYKSKSILKKNGMLALEIGNGQYKKVSKILNRNKFRIEQIISDYKDNKRCLISSNLN